MRTAAILFFFFAMTGAARADDLASKVYLYLHPICPDVVGVSIGNAGDQTTWQISYEGSHNCATQVQAALLAFNPANITLPAPISKAAFLARFTSAELLAIATAAQTVPTINVWLLTAQAHDMIDLNDPLTKQGLDALISAGLLTVNRETVILTP